MTEQQQTITIPFDAPTKAFYQGVNAGSKAREQLAASEVDTHDAEAAYFWLSVGVALGQESDLLRDENLRARFVEGASLRKPEQSDPEEDE